MRDTTKGTPLFGSTAWTAQQFLRMLDREERAKLGRLQGAAAPSAGQGIGDQVAQADAAQWPVPPREPAVPQASLPVSRWDPRANRIIDQILQREVVPGGSASWNDPNADQPATA
jgi:hypothetical protein